MGILVNILLVLSPAITVLTGLILVHLTADKLFNFKPFSFGMTLKFSLTLFVVMSIYLVMTSPILRPVSVTHDKNRELSKIKKEIQDTQIVKPELKDNSFDDSVEDASDTPLFDEAVNNLEEEK